MTFVGSDGPAYASLAYLPSGIIDTVSHGNGISEITVGDATGQPRPCAIFATGKGTRLTTSTTGPCGRTIAFDSGSTTGVQWTTGAYAYDGAGNVKQIGSRQFVYDPVSRLVGASDSGTSATANYRSSTDYQYDVFGNMIQQAFMTQSISTLPGGDGAITHATQPQPVDPATNRLTAATYDDAGNMTARSGNPDDSVYTWDSAGTMRSLTETNRELHFLYTADDERIAVASRPNVSTGFTTTWTPRGFSNQVLRTLVDDNSFGTHAWSWSGDEIWRGSSLVADVTPAGIRHFILDHLGSPRLVTDMSSSANPLTNDFSPFGSGGTTGSGPLQFTGHERDFGNDNQRTLDYMHARYYSASVGRFLSVDQSLNTEKTIHEPQLWNRYAYVTNNPLRYMDPDGQDRWDTANGYFNSLLSDFCLTVRVEQDNADYKSGQRAGDQAGVVAGFVLATASGVGGVVTSPTGVGAVVGGAGVVYGVAAMTNAGIHLAQDSNPRSGESGKQLKTVVEESAAAKKADGLTGKAKQGYEQIKNLLTSGQPGKNQHALSGDLKGWYAADLPGSGGGRGATRVIYKVEDNQVIIKDIINYHS